MADDGLRSDYLLELFGQVLYSQFMGKLIKLDSVCEMSLYVLVNIIHTLAID